jgi:hypothetical protein
MRVTGVRHGCLRSRQGPKGTLSLALRCGHDVQVSAFEPWGPGDVFRSGLREIVAVRAALDALETEFVVHARSRGCKWRELGEDLGLSPHGARKRHLDADPIHSWRSQRDAVL